MGILFDEYLQRVRSLQDISHNIAVHNNRPVIGRLIRISRKVVLKLLRIPLLPLTNKQSAYNIAVADLLGAHIMRICNSCSSRLAVCSKNEVAYREKVRALGIETQVRFWGVVDNIDILRVYNETDVYCLPSIWPENQPVSITEAMACGLPVIATNLGGVSELVLDGVTGFLFPVNDSKMLAAKIMQLRSDEAMRRSFGIAGRECMRSNDFADVACRLSAMYDSLRSEKVREA